MTVIFHLNWKISVNNSDRAVNDKEKYFIQLALDREKIVFCKKMVRVWIVSPVVAKDKSLANESEFGIAVVWKKSRNGERNFR